MVRSCPANNIKCVHHGTQSRIRYRLNKPLLYTGLDWDKKSALAFFGPGGPPPHKYIHVVYIIYTYTTIQKFLNSKIFFFLKKSLLFTKPALILSKIQQKQKYCEIFLLFKITVFCLNIF